MLGAFFKKAIPALAAEPRELGHDGLLHLLEARRGRGKSYTQTWLIKQCAKNRVPVVANFSINLYRLAVQSYMKGWFPNIDAAMAWTHENVTVATHWDDLLTCHNQVVLLDEASRIFDSRSIRSTPPVALEWFQQSRKLKLTIVLASQSFDWLDVRIRQLADVLWMVRKENERRSAIPRTFWLYGLDPWAKGLTESAIRDRADFRAVVPFELLTAQLYNSWELIRIIEGTPSWESMGEVTEYHVNAGHIRPLVSDMPRDAVAVHREAARG